MPIRALNAEEFLNLVLKGSFIYYVTLMGEGGFSGFVRFYIKIFKTNLLRGGGRGLKGTF